MEIPWSQESSHVPVEGNWCSQFYGNLMVYRVCRLLDCVDARSYVLTWPLQWHGVGYIVCIVCHVLAKEMRCVITRLSSD